MAELLAEAALLNRVQQRAIASLERLRGRFTETNEPLYMWLAYVECREASLPWPEWLRKLLLMFLDAEAARSMEKRPPRVFDEKGMSLAAAVWEKAAGGGWSRDAAWLTVSKERGASYPTVRRAWLKYAQLFDLSITYADPSWFQNPKHDLKTTKLDSRTQPAHHRRHVVRQKRTRQNTLGQTTSKARR